MYEGVIDDPYGEFLIDENKSLQKVLLQLMCLLVKSLELNKCCS